MAKKMSDKDKDIPVFIDGRAFGCDQVQVSSLSKSVDESIADLVKQLRKCKHKRRRQINLHTLECLDCSGLIMIDDWIFNESKSATNG